MLLPALGHGSSPDPTVYTVYLGRQSQELPNPNEVSRNVSQVIVHPEYNNLPHDNDMALLRLSSPVTFTSYIQPVCLAAEGSTFNSDTMWVTGWGDINSFDPSFQEFRTTIVNCDPSHTTQTNICTQPLDVQQDDNGSPLVCRMGDMWVQTGILSIPPGSENNTHSNDTVFIQTSPFTYFVTNTIESVPSIVDGAESFSPLSLTYILLLSLPAILQAFY
ncbi:serine protease 38-like protein [Labeo rohita]|uniref:Serine protease 38-like protein n=1 Tax=Labeo rohita TaxID=84645 RepID=A0A498P5P5_LABRO|nr:serine protease 38-like protein [Labeo rohita]